MGRSRYEIYEPTHPHFVTCTILHWISIFTRVETTDVIFESLKYLQQADNLKLYAYVILENHLHLVVSSDDIGKSMRKFKAHTAKEILKLLQEKDVKRLTKKRQPISFGKRGYSLSLFKMTR